ncbi:MAG: family protein phosphatase [Blastocatellia bacterium]|jgi:protein phosphatase|nr:family protein phosphatase [Blastocatellia bacterium]
MKEQTTTTTQIHAAVISDRGLSEKRPLNEDSYLSDTARRIFAVADGVGGANAGEVASQTAMEVLDDAFRNQEANADIEDLMELAIQRANASIHQMAREHPKLAAMATTVVALHLDGRVATIGHVGDSRLYRLSPEGKLFRDTADHSVVEEEVRAGRMTPEQAAHHPSRNVISRALGAEASVEVDMKIVEVEEGTAFLLCSDGITRHIPDNEIRDILFRYGDLEEACTEMKRRCYERGAEDNLTAVVVRVGGPAARHLADLEKTLDIDSSSAMHDTLPGFAVDSGPQRAQQPSQPSAAALTPASRVAFPSTEASTPAPPAAPPPQDGAAPPPAPQPGAAAPPPPVAARPSRGGSFGRALLMILLMAGVGAAAFYAGRYQARQELTASGNTNANANTSPTPTPTPVNTEAEFDKRRRDIDRAPATNVARMEQENGAKPLENADPEFLYLYGRALLLSNRHDDAIHAFKLSLEKLKDSPNRSLVVEAKLAAAVAALRSGNWTAAQTASKDLEQVIDMVNKPATPPPANISGPVGASTPGDANVSPQQ